MLNWSRLFQWETEPMKTTEVVYPKIINIGGTEGSGKTLVATLLGNELSKIKYNVLVVYNRIHPSPLSYLFRNLEDRKFKSLGQLLTSPRLNRKSLESNLVFLKDNNFLSFLGFQSSENYLSYPKITTNQVQKFFQLCLEVVDFVIIDGNPSFPLDVLSDYGYHNHHLHLEVLDPSLKSYHSFKTTQELLGNEWVSQVDNKFYIINKVKDIEGEVEFHNFLNGNYQQFPYCEKLEQYFAQGDLLHDFRDKKYLKIKEYLNKLIQEVILR